MVVFVITMALRSTSYFLITELMVSVCNKHGVAYYLRIPDNRSPWQTFLLDFAGKGAGLRSDIYLPPRTFVPPCFHGQSFHFEVKKQLHITLIFHNNLTV